MSLYSALAGFYDKVFPFQEGTYRFLSSYLKPDPQSVLDIGCGPGHYVGRFAHEGFTSVGMDPNPEMIDLARLVHPHATFYRRDMTEVVTIEERFHLIYCIGNTLSHVPRMTLGRALQMVGDRLVDGGTWIVQTVNWERILDNGAHSFPPRMLTARNLCFHREYKQISEKRVLFVATLEQEGKVLFSEEQWLYPWRPDDLLDLHEDLGFAVEAHFGDYQRTPFDPVESDASIMVLRRRD
jgi:SAM-dependent methyltransferase